MDAGSALQHLQFVWDQILANINESAEQFAQINDAQRLRGVLGGLPSAALDRGEVRVAEKSESGSWQVNEWIKQATEFAAEK